MSETIVDERMRAYYEERAREYDDWWLGEGLFAQRERPGWDTEVSELIAKIEALDYGRVLDVACGTGFLTEHLQGEVVAIDQSASMAQIAAARMPSARVLAAEAVPLPFADASFDCVFTSHFYGHLLADEQTRFLEEAARVAPSIVIVDSAKRAGEDAEQWQQRILNDGSTHRVYKRYFTADALAGEVGAGRTIHAGDWFVAVASR